LAAPAIPDVEEVALVSRMRRRWNVMKWNMSHALGQGSMKCLLPTADV
jgi:hypothetical protein